MYNLGMDSLGCSHLCCSPCSGPLGTLERHIGLIILDPRLQPGAKSGCPPPSPSQETSVVVEDTGEEREEGTDQEVTLPARNSLSSPDEAIMPPLLTTADDFKQFQELFKRVAINQNIPLEEMQENQHNFYTSSKIALPINDAISEP